MARKHKTLTEQVEDYFKDMQFRAWHKCKLRKNKDFLWNPPGKILKGEENIYG